MMTKLLGLAATNTNLFAVAALHLLCYAVNQEDHGALSKIEAILRKVADVEIWSQQKTKKDLRKIMPKKLVHLIIRV